MERTCDLNEIKNGALYCCGRVIKIHEIDQYSIVEYHPWKVNGCTILTGKANTEELNFMPYINGKEINHSFCSLDSALVGVIAYKYEGGNHRADQYFMKMIKGEE
jgi:hypothetical protein